MTRRAWAPHRTPKVDGNTAEPPADPATLASVLDDLIWRYGNGQYPGIMNDLRAYREWLIERHGILEVSSTQG